MKEIKTGSNLIFNVPESEPGLLFQVEPTSLLLITVLGYVKETYQLEPTMFPNLYKGKCICSGWGILNVSELYYLFLKIGPESWKKINSFREL